MSDDLLKRLDEYTCPNCGCSQPVTEDAATRIRELEDALRYVNDCHDHKCGFCKDVIRVTLKATQEKTDE